MRERKPSSADPTVVMIPRRVRLRAGRWSGPVVLGFALQLLMLAALYDLLRTLWCIFCFCTGNNPAAFPEGPWNAYLGLTVTSPFTALLHIAVAGAIFVGLAWLAEVGVWRGRREKLLLSHGCAILAKVINTRQQGKDEYLTYSFIRDGEPHEAEKWVRQPRSIGDHVVVLYSLDGRYEMLYEHCRYEIIPV